MPTMWKAVSPEGTVNIQDFALPCAVVSRGQKTEFVFFSRTLKHGKPEALMELCERFHRDAPDFVQPWHVLTFSLDGRPAYGISAYVFAGLLMTAKRKCELDIAPITTGSPQPVPPERLETYGRQLMETHRVFRWISPSSVVFDLMSYALATMVVLATDYRGPLATGGPQPVCPPDALH